MLLAGNLYLTADSGGTEDGTPTWVGSPTDLSCMVRSYSRTGESVTVDTTTRCSTRSVTKELRKKDMVDLVVDVPDDGAYYFGNPGTTGVYWKLVVKPISTATAETLVCVLRKNTHGSEFDAKQTQSLSFEVQSVS